MPTSWRHQKEKQGREGTEAGYHPRVQTATGLSLSPSENLLLERPGNFPGLVTRWGSGKAALPPTPPSHWKIPESGSWPDLGDTSHSPPGLPEGCLLPDQIQSCFGQPHLLNPTGTQSRRAGTSGPLSEITEPEAISSPAGLRPAAVKQWEHFHGPSAPLDSGRAPAWAPVSAPVGEGLGTRFILPGTSHTPRRGALANASERGVEENNLQNDFLKFCLVDMVTKTMISETFLLDDYFFN